MPLDSDGKINLRVNGISNLESFDHIPSVKQIFHLFFSTQEIITLDVWYRFNCDNWFNNHYNLLFGILTANFKHPPTPEYLSWMSAREPSHFCSPCHSTGKKELDWKESQTLLPWSLFQKDSDNLL